MITGAPTDSADEIEHEVPDGDTYPHRLDDDRMCPCYPAFRLVSAFGGRTVGAVIHMGPEDRP